MVFSFWSGWLLRQFLVRFGQFLVHLGVLHGIYKFTCVFWVRPFLAFWTIRGLVSGMSQQTLQSRADSCGTLAAGAEAAARVGNVQLFRGMSQQELKSKLQVRVSTSENIYFLTIDCIFYISIYIHHVMMGYHIYACIQPCGPTGNPGASCSSQDATWWWCGHSSCGEDRARDWSSLLDNYTNILCPQTSIKKTSILVYKGNYAAVKQTTACRQVLLLGHCIGKSSCFARYSASRPSVHEPIQLSLFVFMPIPRNDPCNGIVHGTVSGYIGFLYSCIFTWLIPCSLGYPAALGIFVEEFPGTAADGTRVSFFHAFQDQCSEGFSASERKGHWGSGCGGHHPKGVTTHGIRGQGAFGEGPFQDHRVGGQIEKTEFPRWNTRCRWQVGQDQKRRWRGTHCHPWWTESFLIGKDFDGMHNNSRLFFLVNRLGRMILYYIILTWPMAYIYMKNASPSCYIIKWWKNSLSIYHYIGSVMAFLYSSKKQLGYLGVQPVYQPIQEPITKSPL